MNTGPILQLDSICKAYGSFLAVDHLSLLVPRASIYGLIGPNGAGKTSTIRMIMNIIAPDSGRILFHGEPWNDRLLDRIGYLPEERGLYKKMKIWELLLFLAEIKSIKRSEALTEISKWLDKMGLSEWKDKRLDDLSKGMQQKVQFIGCVTHHPDLLILDEPFTGLDPINVAQLKEILLDLKAKGKTILLSTHRMDQAEVLCDNICLINKACKVLDGSMRDIKRQYARNAVYVKAAQPVEPVLHGHPAVKEITRRDEGWEIGLSQAADPAAFLRECAQKLDLYHFQVLEASLDEIFIRNVRETA